MLLRLLNTPWIFQVKASIVTIEADQIHKGIVDMVNEHNIKKLVIGAIPE